jgi:hypothetical protein
MSIRSRIQVQDIEMGALREIVWNKNQGEEFSLIIHLLNLWGATFNNGDISYLSYHGIHDEIFLKAQKAMVINHAVTAEDLFRVACQGFTDEIALMAFVELCDNSECACIHLSRLAQEGKSDAVATGALRVLLTHVDVTAIDLLFVAENGRTDALAMTAMEALVHRPDTTIEILDQIRTFAKNPYVRKLAKNKRKRMPSLK